MTVQTSRLALSQPVGADNPSALRTSITTNSNILDKAALYTEGTLATRPAVGAVEHGHLYRSTDTGQFSWSDGTTWRDFGGFAPPTVTSLPGSPYDGQVIDFLADSTNGVVWRLRYRSASGSTYKWEFVGGSDLVTGPGAVPAGSVGGVFGGYGTLGAPMNIITPAAGDYDIEIAGDLTATLNNTTGGSALVQLAAFTGILVAVVNARVQSVSASNSGPQVEESVSAKRRATAISNAQTITTEAVASYAGGGGTTQIDNAYLRVRPVRLG